MSTTFFFYGSLRDSLILEAVLGRPAARLTFSPARLRNHRTERAHGYSFPLLTAAAGATAEGVLIQGLTAEDAARIAYFEDSEYDCVERPVETPNGLRAASVYVASRSLASSGEVWTLDRFQREDRDLLLAVTRIVMTEHYGVTPQPAMERLWGALRDRIAREIELPIKA
jgi:hypothetical protein